MEGMMEVTRVIRSSSLRTVRRTLEWEELASV